MKTTPMSNLAYDTQSAFEYVARVERMLCVTHREEPIEQESLHARFPLDVVSGLSVKLEIMCASALEVAVALLSRAGQSGLHGSHDGVIVRRVRRHFRIPSARRAIGGRARRMKLHRSQFQGQHLCRFLLGHS